MEEHGEQRILETYGKSHRRNYYIIKNKCSREKPDIHTEQKEFRQWQSIKDFFTTVFLPHDYPHSVSGDYLKYQMWDTVQAFASSINGSICTHSVLKGFGVGDETASPLAATITWLLKDGASMVGRIGFAWLQGAKLDSDCKKWRLFADVLNDITLFLDLMSGYFQQYFTLIVCLSGVMKSLVGVAGGCTRAALTQHQARKNNMADVTAKDGSQETLVNLVALICSLMIVPIAAKSFMLTWILFLSMTSLHLCANYFAVKSVVMEIFNEARFKIFCTHFFSQRLPDRLLSVEEVNDKEDVFFSPFSENIQIKLGSSFGNAMQNLKFNNAEIHQLLHIYEDCSYLLCPSRKNSTKIVINVVFSFPATTYDEFQAFYEACCLKHLFEIHKYENATAALPLQLQARANTRSSFKNFMSILESSQFNIKVTAFNVDLWRVKLLDL